MQLEFITTKHHSSAQYNVEYQLFILQSHDWELQNITSSGKEQNSKFKVLLLLNAFIFTHHKVLKNPIKPP